MTGKQFSVAKQATGALSLTMLVSLAPAQAQTTAKQKSSIDTNVVVSPHGMSTMKFGSATKMIDRDMKDVLMSLKELGPKPIAKLNYKQARMQPGPADAVKRTLQKRGMSTSPEKVGSVVDYKVPTPAGPVTVRVYKPLDAPKGPLPVLVYTHGGGYVIASVSAYDSSTRALANAAKCMVVSVAYRQAPEHRLPAAQEDSYAVTQWVMKNVSGWGGDPKRVAVGGESAGGALATTTCMLARDRGGMMPIHQMLIYPYADISYSGVNAQSARENKTTIPLNTPMLPWFSSYALPVSSYGRKAIASPTFGNTQGLPPATVVAAELDPLRTQVAQYAYQLIRSGVPVNMRLYKGVTHEFFGMGAAVPAAKDAVKFAANDLKRVFRK